MVEAALDPEAVEVVAGPADRAAKPAWAAPVVNSPDAYPDNVYCINDVDMVPTIGVRSASVISADGLDFKDSNGSGDLDPYEDWRLSPADRAADLVSKMTTDQMIGLLEWGPFAIGPDDETGDLSQTDIDTLTNDHTRQFLIRWPQGLSAAAIATYFNSMQEQCEALPLGIPFLATTEPMWSRV